MAVFNPRRAHTIRQLVAPLAICARLQILVLEKRAMVDDTELTLTKFLFGDHIARFTIGVPIR